MRLRSKSHWEDAPIQLVDLCWFEPHGAELPIGLVQPLDRDPDLEESPGGGPLNLGAPHNSEVTAVVGFSNPLFANLLWGLKETSKCEKVILRWKKEFFSQQKLQYPKVWLTELVLQCSNICEIRLSYR